jgi:hypothetical protein
MDPNVFADRGPNRCSGWPSATLWREGEIVHFPRSPVPSLATKDLEFLKTEMPRHLRRKNISYHPEVDRVVGVGGGRPVRDRVGADPQGAQRGSPALPRAGDRAAGPDLDRGDVQLPTPAGAGRALSAHASNERVPRRRRRLRRDPREPHPPILHECPFQRGSGVDQQRDVPGGLPPLRPGGRTGARGRRASQPGRRLGNGCYSRLLEAAARMGIPMARLADTSPYDRLMRRFHNFMKDSPRFQETSEGHRRSPSRRARPGWSSPTW